jgi:peptidoglycan/LPS O-acetylase OafA/YrhL
MLDLRATLLVAGGKSRNQRLDVLRGLAILLVLGRHDNLGWLWYRVGWIGVDIFFVLSGFLVSGLIFREYKRTGGVRLRRFWLRRGLRIYPPFLAMIGITLLIFFLTGRNVKSLRILAEFTWTQNYVTPVWGQDWSLAVEEHFYLLLPLLIYVLMRFREADPFRRLPAIVTGAAVALLIARIVHSYLVPFRFDTHVEPTHLRLDSLLFGVLIAYFTQFRPSVLSPLLKRRSLILAGSTILLASCLVWEPPDRLMHTVGFAALYLGAGGLILFAHAANEDPLGLRLRWLALVGEWSYSIYLWHMFVHVYLSSVLHRVHLDAPWIASGGYVVASLLLGYVAHRFVEAPALRWRDGILADRPAAKVAAAHA